MAVKVGTFNVENLFSRPRVLNFFNHANGDELLKTIADLQSELKRTSYNKSRIIELYPHVQEYVKFNVVRSKVGPRIVYRKKGNWHVAASGRNDWFGYLEFKRDKFDDATQKNIARVIGDLDADLLCMVEVEDRMVLERFNTDRLSGSYRYPCNMLIDGNDDRGIDLGLYSRYPIGAVWTNIFEKNKKGTELFSRDCLEVEIFLPSGESLYVLLNHFKSKSGGERKTDPRRKEQAQAVADILTSEYDLKHEFVIVTGDLNDTPERDPLQPLLGLQNLHDVLELQFPGSPSDRWTYHYDRNEQIDYILVSEPLRQAFVKADVFRRGMADVDRYSEGAIKPYKQVTSWRNAASDHGAVWAEFAI